MPKMPGCFRGRNIENAGDPGHPSDRGQLWEDVEAPLRPVTQVIPSTASLYQPRSELIPK
jgi:hypothetical protein